MKSVAYFDTLELKESCIKFLLQVQEMAVLCQISLNHIIDLDLWLPNPNDLAWSIIPIKKTPHQ